MKKRFFSTLLALCMILALLPGTALAMSSSVVTLKPGDSVKLTTSSGGSDYTWWADDPSIVGVPQVNSLSNTITAKKEGSTVVHVQYRVAGTHVEWINGSPMIVPDNNRLETDACSVIVTKEGGDAPGTGTKVPSHTPVGQVGEYVGGSLASMREPGNGLVPVKRGELWGYADMNLRLVIPFQFDSAYEFSDGGITAVLVDSNWYVMDKQCKTILTVPKASTQIQFQLKHTYFSVLRISSGGARQWKHYDLTGNELTGISLTNAIKKEEAYCDARGDLVYWGDDGTNWRFGAPSDYEMKNVLLKIPNIEGACISGSRVTSKTYKENICVVLSDTGSSSKYGAMDKTGKLVIPCQYDWLSDSSGGYMAYKNGDQYGLIKNPVKSGGSTVPNAKTYTITLNANGGSVSPETKSYKANASLGTLPTPTRSGYKFSGWYTAASGGTKVTTSRKVTADIILYAHWTKNPTYTITLNANGGKVSPTSLKVDSGKTYYTQLPTPTRSGYKFDGWYTTKTGSTKITSTTKATANRTIYAHWTRNRTYMVTFDPNGGMVYLDWKAVSTGVTYRELPTPTRSGYHFKGWYTKKTGGTKVTETTRVNLTANQTLYARWQTAAVTAKSTEKKAFTVTVPVYYELALYSTVTGSKVATTVETTGYQDIRCTQKATLSNGTVRYYGKVNNKNYWFTYSCEMDVR